VWFVGVQEYFIVFFNDFLVGGFVSKLVVGIWVGFFEAVLFLDQCETVD